MDWDDLRFFLAAHRGGSLAAAARELGCEYTTVGRRLAALERDLGTKLFTRTSDGLEPTPAAAELVPLAVDVERATRAIEARAAVHDERVEGAVRVTCPEGFSLYLVDRLAELRARHPGLTLEIVTDVRPLDLGRGEAEIALRMGAEPSPDLVTRTLATMPWRMFASPDYVARRGAPSPVTDLRGHDVVAYEAPLAHVPGARWLDAHGEGANVVLRGNSMRVVVDAAAAGVGLTVLPCFLARKSGGLTELAPDELGARALSLVVHRDVVGVARVRAAIDFLVEAVRRDHAAGLFG